MSVVVTTFNRCELLSETLESILSQTFRDLEVIVIDNMSSDGTEARLQARSDPRIRYYRNPNQGIIAVNRNFGIRQAHGVYVAFCDDDDLWKPQKLEAQVWRLEEDRSLAMCYTHAETFSGGNTIAPRLNRRHVTAGHFHQLLSGNFIANSTVLARRDVLLDIGLLSENSLIREDYELWLRIARYHRMAGLEESLVRYRIHPANAAGNRASETLRAIRTLKSVRRLLDISTPILWSGLLPQYLKYLVYRLKLKR